MTKQEFTENMLRLQTEKKKQREQEARNLNCQLNLYEIEAKLRIKKSYRNGRKQ